MTRYLKDDFKWDFGIFSSKINLRLGSVSESIDEFIACIKRIETEKQEQQVQAEEVHEIEIDGELGEELSQLLTNLQNRVFYNSLLITAYSFLEYALTEYCRMLENYIEADVGPYHSYEKGKGIDKSKAYLKEAFEINISDQKEWSQLKTYGKVRNLIIHNDGNIITDSEKALNEQNDFKELNKIPELDITETGYIHIQDVEYIKSLLEKSTTFLNSVIETTNEKIKTAANNT